MALSKSISWKILKIFYNFIFMNIMNEWEKYFSHSYFFSSIFKKYMIEEENNKCADIWEHLSILEKEIMFLKKKSAPTLWEKIDFIYITLKAQQRNARIKLFIKILLFLYGLYFILYYLPNLPQKMVDDFKNGIWENVSSLVSPIVENVVKNAWQDIISNTEKGTLTGVSLDEKEMDDVLKKANEILNQ